MGYQKCMSGFLTIDIARLRPPGFLARMREGQIKKKERVDRAHGWQAVDACPLCKCEDREDALKKHGIQGVCCKRCSLYYSMRVPARIEDIYCNASYVEATAQDRVDTDLYRKKRFAEERIDLIKQHLSTSAERPRLLDVGCGTGWFLEVASEHGFDVAGQDLAGGMGDYTGRDHTIPAFNCPISDLPPEPKYDVITLFDVIEHVHHPLQVVFDCRRLLSDDGILVVFTPNFDSLAVHVAREESNIISPTDHVVLFSRESVDMLAELSELELAYYHCRGCDLGDLKSYYEWKGDEATASACQGLYDAVQPVIDAAGAGNHMRFILRRRR